MAAAQAAPRLVVFGWGNTSRGDDAAGPLLLADIEAAALPGVRTVEDWQLQIEHALDIVGAELVLFIDAGQGTPAPFSFEEARPAGVFAASTHALSPAAVLSVYERVHGQAAPPAFVLCVRGEAFGLGEPMSAAASRHLAAARAFALALCRVPDAARWRVQLTVPVAPVAPADHSAALSR